MLKRIRQVLAALSVVAIMLLFLDFTGTVHQWWGWMAKIQFLPALMAVNVGVIIALIVATLIFGRLYCSIICPLGIMQDGFGWLGKKMKKNRYSYSAAKSILRYTMLCITIIAIIFGISVIVTLLAPYSAFGRIVQNILSPLWQTGNNILAGMSERADNYMFYSVDVIWVKSAITLTVALATLVILGVLAWRNGRTYCNTICPVGTILGFFAKYSYLKPLIDTTKCNSCGLCARNCKSSCINSKEHTIDYTRCVGCMDCIGKCHKNAISYTHKVKATEPSTDAHDNTRRQFMSIGATLLATAAVKATEKTVDGGLAAIVDKKIPNRETHLVPPGAKSIRNMNSHCTACQLCVAVCPNGVLRPSSNMERMMQPESSYEKGYCRPECTKCSEVCPTGAICKITVAEKSSIQIGHAVWVKDNCVPLTDGYECGNCARHCPTGAITMMPSDASDETSPKIPTVNVEKCIGCGACENLCPARPFSAIYVEGHENHRVI